MAEYIEREALLIGMDSTISRLRVAAGENVIANSSINLVQVARDFVANVPSADVVKVRHGRFLKLDHDEWWGAVYECCECKGEFMLGGSEQEANYCPHCGAQKWFGKDGTDNANQVR